MSKKKILICDDHSLFGFGIQAILERHGYMVLVVQSSFACLDYLRTNKVDVLLIDLNIDSKTGFDIFLELETKLTETTVFLLTAFDEPYLIQKCKRLGFNGFLSKETPTEELIKAIELDKLSDFLNKSTPDKVQSEIILNQSKKNIQLSPHEKEIIRLIAEGGTSKSIAEKLFISKTTVDTHRRNIYRKLEITGLSSLIRFANENIPST